jgi:pimeloyl-ACP methyl ester carboxylesterase
VDEEVFMRSPFALPHRRRRLAPLVALIALAALALAVPAALSGLSTAVPSDRTGLSVEISGPAVARSEGAAVVLVPGLMGCAHGYRHVVADLNRAGLPTIVIEPLGIGASPRPPDADYSLTAQAARLGTALDDLGVRQAILVAHGVSAGMALRLALERPALVAGIVSLEGGATESTATPGLRRALTLARLTAKLGGKHVLRQKLEQELREASGDASWVEGITFRRYFNSYGHDLEASIAALGAMAAATEPAPLAPRLPEVACPVVLLVGEAPHSGGIDAAEIDRLTAALPDLTVQRLPGCGHYIMEEQPAAVVAAVQALAPRVVAFRAKTPPPPVAGAGMGP